MHTKTHTSSKLTFSRLAKLGCSCQLAGQLASLFVCLSVGVKYVCVSQRHSGGIESEKEKSFTSAIFYLLPTKQNHFVHFFFFLSKSFFFSLLMLLTQTPTLTSCLSAGSMPPWNPNGVSSCQSVCVCVKKFPLEFCKQNFATLQQSWFFIPFGDNNNNNASLVSIQNWLAGILGRKVKVSSVVTSVQFSGRVRVELSQNLAFWDCCCCCCQ